MSINKIRNSKITETMNHINYTKLKSFADSIDWSEPSQINDPNTAFNGITKAVMKSWGKGPKFRRSTLKYKSTSRRFPFRHKLLTIVRNSEILNY